MKREVDDHWKHWSGQEEEKSQTVNYYFTFGFNQGYDNGYVKVTVPASSNAHGEARTEMVRRHGTKWGFQYSEADFLPQLKRWPLWEVK